MNTNARRQQQPDEPSSGQRPPMGASTGGDVDEHGDRDAHDGGPTPTRAMMETAQQHEQSTEEVVEALETAAASGSATTPSSGKPWRFGLHRRREHSDLPGLARSTTAATPPAMHQRPARSITGDEDPEAESSSDSVGTEGEQGEQDEPQQLQQNDADNPAMTPLPPPFDVCQIIPEETMDLVKNMPVLQLEVIPQGRNMSCSICACSYEAKDLVVNLPCNHLYHFKCIVRWFFVEATNKKIKADMTGGSHRTQQQRSSLPSIPFWRRFRRGGRSTSVTTTTAAQSKKCQFPSSCPMCRCSVSLNDYESNDDPLWNARQQQQRHTGETTNLNVWTGGDKVALEIRYSDLV
eukprot:CAMPEP_0119570640 /NCGR_PEP_ID=MMETSP1352-20130426/43714_1 /TAXON_ID=265584 /ORGANISM="Stauroneis constricta, Strain CCMP1120" /LENGTH=349 /DNA_ID=CAMNT_0007620309 /DNA_START=153 /DNA_END=1202 /DNA_ORIENTATION=-